MAVIEQPFVLVSGELTPAIFLIEINMNEIYKTFTIVALTFCVVLAIFIVTRESKDSDTRILFMSNWKANGCYVYKSECGVNRKYACEIVTESTVPFVVGNQRVTPYSTCEILK